jgi:flagellar basal-body rod protein FlgF
MDNSFVVGLSAQQVLRQRMDVTANNLANMSTAGFKAESLVMRELTEKPAMAADLPKDVAFVDAWMLQRDFATGPLELTGNPLDAAIEGEGFFAVQTPTGTAYTRDGRFSINDAGEIITRNGYPVLGAGGPIVVDTAQGAIAIGRDGSINQNNLVLGKFDVVAFDTPAGLEKLGDNLWKATDEAPRPPASISIAGGFVEGSNVNAIAEMTQMIEISRRYESVSKMISDSDQLRSTSIEKLARLG